MHILVLGIKIHVDQEIRFESHFSFYKALPNATLVWYHHNNLAQQAKPRLGKKQAICLKSRTQSQLCLSLYLVPIIEETGTC